MNPDTVLAPPQPLPPPRGFGHRLALLGIGIAVGVIILLLIVIGVVAVALDLDADSDTVLGASLIGQGVANFVILGLILMRARRTGGALRDFGFRALNLGRAWWVVIAFVIAAYATIGLYDVAMDLAGLDSLRPESNIDDDLKDTTWIFILAGVFAVLIAPLTEEMFFRGLVFSGFRRDFGLAVGLVASSLLFGLVHGQLTLILPFSLVGGYLALAYMYTRSLWGSIACHLTFNVLSFAALALS
ncbi:MAG: type II CAAX endopeptidase family protein [Dehalococcoidia bacterium]